MDKNFNPYYIEAYYEMLNSKSANQMKLILHAFSEGKHKNDPDAKAALKSQIAKSPISFNESLKKEKEIYDRLLEIL